MLLKLKKQVSNKDVSEGQKEVKKIINHRPHGVGIEICLVNGEWESWSKFLEEKSCQSSWKKGEL